MLAASFWPRFRHQRDSLAPRSGGIR
jgi:hypothetical protein